MSHDSVNLCRVLLANFITQISWPCCLMFSYCTWCLLRCSFLHQFSVTCCSSSLVFCPWSIFSPLLLLYYYYFCNVFYSCCFFPYLTVLRFTGPFDGLYGSPHFFLVRLVGFPRLTTSGPCSKHTLSTQYALQARGIRTCWIVSVYKVLVILYLCDSSFCFHDFLQFNSWPIYSCYSASWESFFLQWWWCIFV